MTESTLTPQAPLDLGRLESEAKIAATKYVSNLLQVSLNFATTVKHIYIYKWDICYTVECYFSH